MEIEGLIIKNFQINHLNVHIYQNRRDLGESAGRAVAGKIRELLETKGKISIVFAAAASQNEFLDYLSRAPNIDWSRVTAFHMDEYIGLPGDHPQLFANYLQKRIFDRVKPGKVYLLNGETASPASEIERYRKLLEDNPLDIACIGIGENGHIAFNDPAFADFDDPYLVKVVEPDQISRLQQVHDGCFRSLEEVPTRAFSLTIPALTAAKWIYCMVPGATKREAVRRTVKDPISTACPATVLRSHDNARLFLDLDSAGDLLNEN